MARLKTYYEEGIAKQFYKEGYSHSVIKKARKARITVGEMEQQIADKVCKALSTVHGWRCDSSGGPSDIDTVKELGQLLDNNPDAFLIIISEDTTMTKLTDRQLNAFKRVHDEIKLFISDYYDTDGFFSFVHDEEEKVYKSLPDSADEADYGYAYQTAEGRAQGRAQERWGRVLFVLEQEYFDLHGTDLYDELWHLIQEMNETWLSMKPVHLEVETDDGFAPDIIDDERMNRYEKELKSLVDKYN